MLSVSSPQVHEVDPYPGLQFITSISCWAGGRRCTNTALVISACLPVLLALNFRFVFHCSVFHVDRKHVQGCWCGFATGLKSRNTKWTWKGYMKASDVRNVSVTFQIKLEIWSRPGKVMISSICLFGFGLVGSFLRVRMRQGGARLWGRKERRRNSRR